MLGTWTANLTLPITIEEMLPFSSLRIVEVNVHKCVFVVYRHSLQCSSYVTAVPEYCKQ